MDPLKSRSQATTVRILEATAFCVGSIGIEKTSITEIAKKAGVSRGLVAHYCSKKDDLFMMVVKHIVQAAYQRFSRVDPEWTPAECLSFTLHENCDFFIENPHYLSCFLLFYYYATFKDEFRKLNTSLRDAGVHRISESIRQMTPSTDYDDLARAIHRELTAGIQLYRVTDEVEVEGPFKKKLLKSIEARIAAHLNQPYFRLPAKPAPVSSL